MTKEARRRVIQELKAGARVYAMDTFRSGKTSVMYEGPFTIDGIDER
jgi:hypothetical protein